MCSYATINGTAACQNQDLLKTTLDQRWAFPGFVTADFSATHSTVPSADAGLDQEMPAPQFYGPALQSTTLAHQAVSTDIAEAATVLLKNAGDTLPLSANGAGTVAVIGPAASASPTDTGGGSAFVTSTFNVTPLQGIQAAAGPGTTVQSAQGLPTDTSLTPIPTSSLTPAYNGTGGGRAPRLATST